MAAAEQNNVIEGEAVVKQTVSSGSSRKNELPELPESMQKVKHTKKVELNELADYVADDYGEDKPKELSKLGRRKQYVEEEWPEREEYKSTNAFGLPKKEPFKALKQEWPPKEIRRNLTDENGNVITNVFDLPKNFTTTEARNFSSENEGETEQQSWYPDEPKPDYLEAKDGESTNALGVPQHWYERKQLELQRKQDEESGKVPQLTEEEIEEIRVNAHRKGYDTGYREGLAAGHDEGMPIGIEEGKKSGFDEGYAQGMEQAKQDMQEKISYFEQAVQQLAVPLENLDNQIADALVNFALNLTEQLVHLGVDRSKTYIVTAVNEAVSMLPVLEEGVTITVNQHDRDILAEAYNEEELEKRKWKIMVENTMNNGDLQVEAKDSSISQTLEKKIQDLVKAFVSANLQ